MLNSVLNGDWSNPVPGRQFPKGIRRSFQQSTQLPTVAATSSSCCNLWKLFRICFPEVVSNCQILKLFPSHRRSSPAPLEFFFQEQSYSSLNSGWSLAWDHVRGDIDDACGAIADFCGVIGGFCGVIAIGGRRSLRNSINIIKHC